MECTSQSPYSDRRCADPEMPHNCTLAILGSDTSAAFAPGQP